MNCNSRVIDGNSRLDKKAFGNENTRELSVNLIENY